MSNEFLANYTIPIAKNNNNNAAELQQIDEAEKQPTTEVNYASDRYIPPGKQGTNFVPQSARQHLKRKSNVFNTRPDNVVETAEDGKMIIFQGRDESYPEQLNKLIHPFECELCVVKLNSITSARDHYESKSHDRKIRAWLVHNYTDKGLEPPAIKRHVPMPRAEASAATSIVLLHCKVCDLKLTSFLHAKQHYAGRKHRLAANKQYKPAGAGHYNDEGKWVRKATAVPILTNDGRFGIGSGFKNESADDEEAAVESSVEDAAEVTEAQPDDALHCQVCDISVTSAAHMDMHLTGAKHRKKVQQSAAATETVAANDSILSSLNEPNCSKISTDLYRTPTGSFYCQICNVNMTHEAMLKQHLDGKKHLKKVTEDKLKQAAAAAAAEKKPAENE